jgi:hypothetical protein
VQGETPLTTLFSSPSTLPRPKHSMLPVLVVLFLLSYGLMTLLIVEQGSTIQSQHNLIQELLGDTRQLAAMKGKAVREKYLQEQALSRQAQSKTQDQAASTQASTNTPATQAEPSTEASPAEKTKTSHVGKAQRPLPERPTKPASDIADARRNLMSI